MRRFNPQMRVDQFTEYQTSVHGMRNARGDQNVATCTSCHSVHDIGSVRNPQSPVYSTQVALTCSKCHSDPKLMTTYKIPADQFEKYRKSVHAAALIDRQDLAAPTCNDCHGNHGARPPGVDSVATVCGQCHRQESTLFGQSPHQDPFKSMDLAGCVFCHDNHEVHKTDDRMLSTQGAGICAICHSEGDNAVPKVGVMQTSILRLRLEIDTASEILARAERAGMEVSKPKFELQQAGAELVRSRVAVHAFNPDAITSITGPASNVAAGARKSADAALEEVATRRRGLGYSLIGIAIVIFALIMKIREIDARHHHR
jgi:predicted CXXCH cytochrome family protein